MNRDKKDIFSVDKDSCIHRSSIFAIDFEVTLLDFLSAMQVQCPYLKHGIPWAGRYGSRFAVRSIPHHHVEYSLHMHVSYETLGIFRPPHLDTCYKRNVALLGTSTERSSVSLWYYSNYLDACRCLPLSQSFLFLTIKTKTQARPPDR